MENICDYKNCKKIGKHKAPIEKDNSKKFRWLCLDHIKEFNRSWDYFTKKDVKNIIQFMKSDKKKTDSKIKLILISKIGKTLKPRGLKDSILKNYLITKLF